MDVASAVPLACSTWIGCRPDADTTARARNGQRCALLRALMTVSRSVVGVGDGELAGPVGFGVEEGFSAGGEGVAELEEGESELLDAFDCRFRCAGRFALVTGRELLR